MLSDNPIEWLLVCLLVEAAVRTDAETRIQDPRLRHETRQWVARHRYAKLFPPVGWTLDDRRYWRAIRSETPPRAGGPVAMPSHS